MLNNNKIVRAHLTEEYVDMIRQAIDEESMKDGSYQFATGDLPYVAMLEKHRESLVPFKYLLKRINETHNKGLEI